ncbi:MAG: anti-sigma factor domain-containing protein [Thermosediminibacteraceae bacterium]|nr:anti-sigma factor domain-containing protein [Thermosediminibacteraceae bacterium]
MKAVIVEKERDYIIVVSERGDFKKIYNTYKDRQIGDEIDIPEENPYSILFRRIASLAAVFILTVVLAGYCVAFFSPVTYVTMDVNPSVEISLNRFDRVIEVEGLNEDGARIVGDKAYFKSMPAEEVVRILLERAREHNLIGPDSVVVFTISNVRDEKKPQLEKKLEETAKKEMEETGNISIQQQGQENKKILVQQASIKLHNQAKSMGISQGKLLLYEKLKKEDPRVDLERIKKMRVKDILEELKSKAEKKEKEKSKKRDETPAKPVEEKEKGKKAEIKNIPVRDRRLNEKKNPEKNSNEREKPRIKGENNKDKSLNNNNSKKFAAFKRYSFKKYRDFIHKLDKIKGMREIRPKNPKYPV